MASSTEESPSIPQDAPRSGAQDEPSRVIWVLVDHSARAEAFESVAEAIGEMGGRAQIVTISEVIGGMARDALAGGAERVLRGLRVAVQGRSDEDLLGAVRRETPDVLAITNARHVRALSLIENLTGTAPFQVGVLPDFSLHDAWFRSGLGAFIVPHEEMATRLVESQVAHSDRVLIAGPAVSHGFSESFDRASLRDEFGFSHSERLVLVRVESFDVATIEKLVFQAKLVEGKDTRFIFHHGGDASAASTLRRAADEYGLQALMFGKVDGLERYASMTDVVITSPADPMMPEIVALGLPVLMVGGAQEANSQADFLSRHGIGHHVPDLLRLGSEIERFLRPESLKSATEAAQAIGLPGGSREVAEALWDITQKIDAWRAHDAPRHEPSGDRDGSSDEERKEQGPHTSGAFESIGQGGQGAGSGDQRRDDNPNEFKGISRAEAKEQLAQLILSEREIERRLSDLEREQQRWRSRFDMAREWNEQDLAAEAEQILRGYIDEAAPLQRDLDAILRQKAKLKEAANPTGAPSSRSSGPSTASPTGSGKIADVERRFQEMEQDRDLGDLKDRIDRELGE